MRPTSIALVEAMTSHFQTGEKFRRPSEFVLIKRPPGADDFFVPEAKLPDVISIEIDQDIESTAKTFTITCANENGLLSPDYKQGKFPSPRINHEVPSPSPWRNVLVPETEVVIYLGYQGNYLKMLTGSIDEVNIDGEGKTIKITGRSMYKRAMANTLVPQSGQSYIVPDKKTNLGTAVGKLLDAVKVTNEVFLINEPGTKEPFLAGIPVGKRREFPNDIISEMVDSTYNVLTENAHGVVKLRPMPNFTRAGKAVFTFDQYFELKETDYTIDDSDMYNAILIKCGKEANRFSSKSIQNSILHGQYRETEVELPWADTYEKRRYAAQALFNQMAMRWRKMTIGVPAYLPLELLDVVLIRERISQVNWNMHIRGIKTMFTSSGLFQLLELADNTGFKIEQPEHPVPPPSDLPPFTINDASITIEVWDWSIEDGDRLNVYFNGRKIKSSVMIKKTPFKLELNLNLGANTVIFEGISAGTSQELSAIFRVIGSKGNVIYNPDDLPSLTMARVNVISKSGYYDPQHRPRKNWVITRQ